MACLGLSTCHIGVVGALPKPVCRLHLTSRTAAGHSRTFRLGHTKCYQPIRQTVSCRAQQVCALLTASVDQSPTALPAACLQSETNGENLVPLQTETRQWKQQAAAAVLFIGLVGATRRLNIACSLQVDADSSCRHCNMQHFEVVTGTCCLVSQYLQCCLQRVTAALQLAANAVRQACHGNRHHQTAQASFKYWTQGLPVHAFVCMISW